MNRKELYQQIQAKKSMLCVGLDVDFNKMPEHVKALANRGELAIKGELYKGKARSIIEFNKAIVDATAPYAVAYKPNTAFYEAEGLEGWKQLEMTVNYIKEKYPEILIIADAKRGDIGNTAKRYAKCFFESMPCDAVTLAPYMGKDSVQPFLDYKGKWSVVLALTSNASANDFEMLPVGETPLYEKVIKTTMTWGTKEDTMFVVGATRPEKLAEIREYCPDNFFLVPGVGAQGGSAEEVIAHGSNDHGGLLINSSRGILFADNTENYAKVAGEVAARTANL